MTRRILINIAHPYLQLNRTQNCQTAIPTKPLCGIAVFMPIRCNDMNRLITLIIICSVALMSCTRKVYVPTETVRTEYKDRVVEAVRVDTVAMRDSVAVYVNGDTVRITKYRDRWRTRIVERHDTVNVAKVDSVAVPVEVPKPYPVERKLTRWERTKMDAGGIAIGILGVAALGGLAWLAWLVYKKRRR